MNDNLLYFGDNLDVLRIHIDSESVDLIYLDPPFNSNADYNVLFTEQDGSRAAAQIKAFQDTWRWDQVSAYAYHDFIETGPHRVSQVMLAFRTLLGESNMLAYLSMMAPRLVELHRVLKPTGSIYLHCDPTSSHYLKILMDGVFGAENFLNEIIWKRTGAHNSSKKYGPVHDVLLYFAKGRDYVWNQQYQSQDEYIAKRYTYIDDKGKKFYPVTLHAPGTRNGSSGQSWRGIDITAKGGHWKYGTEKLDQLDGEGKIYWPSKGSMPRLKMYEVDAKGSLIQDIWQDIPAINSQAQERLGYPTQKPETLLERIITSSSAEGDIILDPFCGCGTTVSVSQRLRRRWVGIDITHLSIALIKSRLLDTYGPLVTKTFKVIGEPVSLPDAAALAEKDRYEFQYWALGLVQAQPLPSEQKKGADGGIDGRITFHDEGKIGKPKYVIFSVKSGKADVSHLRDLRGVLDREKAQIGVLITLQEPTSAMKKEAASGDFYTPPFGVGIPQGTKYPKLQIFTIEELLRGAQVQMPISLRARAFRAAPKSKGKTFDAPMFEFG